MESDIPSGHVVAVGFVFDAGMQLKNEASLHAYSTTTERMDGMELTARERDVTMMALMLYATSDVHWNLGKKDRSKREIAFGDRAVAKEAYYKLLCSQAGVSTTTPRVVPLGTASGLRVE